MGNIFFQKKCRKNLPQIKKRVYLHSQNGITPWSTCFSTAEIAQLVEHNLAKVGVASSSLVFRSKSDGWLNANHFYFLQTDSPLTPSIDWYGCGTKEKFVSLSGGNFRKDE